MLPVRVDAAAVRVAVLQRPRIAGGDADREAAVLAQRQHFRAALAGDVGRAVGGAVVDDEDVRAGQGLAQVVEHARQARLLVPRRDEDHGSLAALRPRELGLDGPQLPPASGAAPSSQTTARGLGTARTAWSSVAMPATAYTRVKKKRLRKTWSGAVTTSARSIPRSRSSGSVRAAFSAVVRACGSTTGSTSGPSHASCICSASEGPLPRERPVNTTASALRPAARRRPRPPQRRHTGLIRYLPRRRISPPGITIAVRRLSTLLARGHLDGRGGPRLAPFCSAARHPLSTPCTAAAPTIGSSGTASETGWRMNGRVCGAPCRRGRR